MEDLHAEAPPSGATRWEACPGSIALSKLYPEQPDTEAAREGTAAHWALEEAMAGRMIAEGQIAPNGWVLDEDMVDGAELFRDCVPVHLRPYLQVEKYVTMYKRIHAKNWGTPDAWAADMSTMTIHVWDYKFGHGYVEVFENLQLIDYVAGIAEQMGIDDRGEIDWWVELHIVQPRVWHRDGHVRTWRCHMTDLRQPWHRLHQAATLAFQPNPPLQVGLHCEHCPARHACTPFQETTSQVARIFDYSTPLELPDNALGYEYRQLKHWEKLLEARISGLEADAEARLKRGARVPWLTLESAPGRERWTMDTQLVLGMGRAGGVDLAKPVQVITPTQARAAGMPDAMVDAIAARAPTAKKVTLVSAKDLRRTFQT